MHPLLCFAFILHALLEYLLFSVANITVQYCINVKINFLSRLISGTLSLAPVSSHKPTSK